jgi:hypothetical protein
MKNECSECGINYKKNDSTELEEEHNLCPECGSDKETMLIFQKEQESNFFSIDFY